MSNVDFPHPEPVSVASQLAVLPFVAAVSGLLRPENDDPALRVTMHRLMVREGRGYLQQMCFYLGGAIGPERHVGRIFHVTEGIMGKAFATRHILRTKHYDVIEDMVRDLELDMKETGETRRPTDVGHSYLAVPFLGPHDQAVMILYADTKRFNFFGDDAKIHRIKAMGDGFCRLFDHLQENPFPELRNFPLHAGDPSKAAPTVYRRLQEELDLPPPRFQKISSFNFEASVA